MSHKIGLYIHIPFCKAKCYYCDFNSFANKTEIIPQYFDALKQEIMFYSKNLRDYEIKTIFIGGGTPSAVDVHYINEIMDMCKKNFNVEKDAEISIETNPGTLSYEKLAAYKSMGINRLSIGLQVWQNRLLKSIGRIHGIEDFLENYNQARKAGFDNINVDLIFGLPGQTLEEWASTLSNVINLGVEHISCYSLKIEDGTVFGKWLDEGTITLADEELDREMYHLAIGEANKANLRHYEISNFSKEGFECKHNLIYWKAEQYIGIGAGSHSYFNNERFNNTCDINNYISNVGKHGCAKENVQLIDKNESMSEYIILGFRLTNGISAREFECRFGKNIYNLFGKQLNKVLDKGLIELNGDRIKLTPLGLDIANQVFIEFI